MIVKRIGKWTITTDNFCGMTRFHLDDQKGDREVSVLFDFTSEPSEAKENAAVDFLASMIPSKKK